MLSIYILTIVFCITLPSALANIVLDQRRNGLQQIPIGEAEVETLTFHFTTTRTRFEFEFYTTTMTREHTPTAQPTPTVSSQQDQPQLLSGSRRADQCDETACAICTWYYKCERGTPACFQCDTKSYCEC